MRATIFLHTLLFLIGSAAYQTGLADAAAAMPHSGRVGCPHCKNDGSEVSQMLQKADALYADFKPAEALKELLAVLKTEPDNQEALLKTARAYIDVGDMVSESAPDAQQKKLQQYLMAEEYARKSVKAYPNVTWGHFYVAASLGKIATQSPISKQIDLSNEIREATEKALALDPNNGFAYHIYGVWQRKVAEIGQMKRLLASTFLGRSVPQGSMEKSLEYLKKAISLNPKVLIHYLELAKTHIVLQQWQPARNALKTALQLPIQFSDDAANKKEAQALLEEINDRS